MKIEVHLLGVVGHAWGTITSSQLSIQAALGSLVYDCLPLPSLSAS